jgi:beta-glucosidase
MLTFPRGFLWGAATAAYQVEGGNDRSDWWPWEKSAGKECSGRACCHYEKYDQDFDLAQSLSHNAHRFSIEWGRIEPEEGKFSQEALDHYRAVLLALKSRGMEPIITLHHFTNPVWFAALGGWENKKAVQFFLRYAEFVVRALAPHARIWITINEPSIYASHAYLFGVWPPQGKSFWKMLKVENRLTAAHIKAYRLIHQIYRDANLARPSVSIAHHMIALIPCTQSFRDRFATFLRHKLFNERYLDLFCRNKALDFIGVNYYSRQLVDVKKWGVRNLFADVCEVGHHPTPKNSLGWDVYPEGLYQLLLRLKKYELPIMITENGICTSEDIERWEFISSHLKSVHKAMEQGVPLIGYLYWSLLDNFEWDKGFGPRFGLIEMDYKTQNRMVRESAVKFSRICKTGSLG